MRGRRILERILTDSTRTRSETMTSLMGTRMSIGTPSRAVAVLKRTNRRVAEAIGTRSKSRLRRRRRSRRERKKI